MNEEDQNQLVSQLRNKAEGHRQFLKTNQDWSHPMTEAVATVAMVVYDELADIIESLRTT